MCEFSWQLGPGVFQIYNFADVETFVQSLEATTVVLDDGLTRLGFPIALWAKISISKTACDVLFLKREGDGCFRAVLTALCLTLHV